MAEPARLYRSSDGAWSEGGRWSSEVEREESASSGPPDFETIFAEFGDAIFSYVYRLMGNAEDARDFTQDTFIRAYTALPRMPADLQVRPWLYRIATNICLDELRRRQRIRWTPWESLMARFWDRPSEDPGPERVLVAREDAIAVQRVLAELPPRYRSALLLREYQDLSYEQIAATLRTSVGGVKSLLYRAREAFRGTYQRMAQEEGWLDQPALGGAVDAL